MKTQPCKWCGKITKGTTCGACLSKQAVLPRYAAIRDKLRKHYGLPPLTSDENTCSIVD